MYLADTIVAARSCTGPSPQKAALRM